MTIVRKAGFRRPLVVSQEGEGFIAGLDVVQAGDVYRTLGFSLFASSWPVCRAWNYIIFTGKVSGAFIMENLFSHEETN